MIKKIDITTKIRKIARIHDLANGTFSEVLQFSLPSGVVKKIELPASALWDRSVLASRLRDAGAILPVDHRSLLENLAKAKADKDQVYAANTGWTKDRNNFVLRDTNIGPDQAIVGVNSHNTSVGVLSRHGTSKKWARTVGKFAAQSSLLMCSVCAAFAGPLLRVANVQSFTLCIFGGSRDGKTIASIVAGSVIGASCKEDLATWNITDARLQQALTHYNDSIFVIDDFQAISEGKRYERVKHLAYLLAQGRAKARHSTYENKHGGENASWLSLILTSSEFSVAELAALAKNERQDGEVIRMIDLPSRETGEAYIWDRIGKPPTEKESESLFEQIALACEDSHGKAFLSYIKHIVKKKDLREYVRARCDYFMRRVTTETDNALVRDIARKFALLYAGGCLARQAKLVDWPMSEIRDAVAVCFHRSRKMIRDERAITDEGMERLTAAIHKLPRLTQKSRSHFTEAYCNKINGFRTRRNGRHIAFVRRDAFERIFVSQEQARLVEAELIAKDLVSPAKANAGNKPSAKKQHRWPDGIRRRSLDIQFEPAPTDHG